MTVLNILKPRTINTAFEIHEHQVIGAAIPKNGYLVGYHITDEPDQVLRSLRSLIDLTIINPTGDLGGGLYISSVPEFWFVRSASRWNYLLSANILQRTKLVKMILQNPNYLFGSDYLTLSELNILHKDLDTYVQTGVLDYLMYTAGQPYNVSITKEMTAYAGLPSPTVPSMIQIQFIGKFLNIEGLYYNEIILNTARSWAEKNNPKLLYSAFNQQLINPWLKSLNYDGAFTKSSMATNPEMVIWNRQAIQQFNIEPQ